MNFYEFYARLCGQNNIKHEQLVRTAAFNASGWILAKKYSRRILILNI
jgi:hypothetical protein